ncbi:type II toxin-antitoxin system PemK/MazF family toxin [Belnapia rosea]|uniref:type II toxin-antitoxin system PemK/MazF family toxin n=1 Tax=Belnapia rosea TaxID=938405 RepID=UPI000881E9E2|nr:type II toxin-antitoxin system PemK/MazF family toxin [Belnapia rosea]SDB07379.1 mRNA-degrading endonuclease, toxin component of the MazEF toxin-antitoxin module [Belnapia rosea]
MSLALRAGQIVLADWRDGLPKEPNKRRPAIVVEDDDLFPDYPNVILVPLTEDAEFAPAGLAVRIEPTADNGCAKPCYALPHHVAATSKLRLRATESRITPQQLSEIRERIAIAIGLA